MDTLHHLAAWAVANPDAALFIVGALISIANGAITSLPGERGPLRSAILGALDRASVLSQANATGTLKLPGWSSWGDRPPA